MPFKHKHPILISSSQFDALLRNQRLSVKDLAPIAQQVGVTGVEYREVYWHDPTSEIPFVREQIGSLGLQLSYAVFHTLYNGDEASRDQLLADIDVAHALGSPRMRLFRGEKPASNTGPVWDGARRAIDKAAELGLTLALENYVRVPGNKLEEIVETLAAFESPALGTNLDTSNYTLNGQDVILAIRQLRSRIVYSHLKDVKQTADGPKVTFIGDGGLAFGAILAELDQVDRDVPFCFEFGGQDDPEAAIRQSLANVARLEG